MPTVKEKKRGVKKYRTIKLGKNKYAHVAVVKKAGKRGGHAVMGKVHTRKGRGK